MTWEHYVSHLDLQTATVFGVVVKRPDHMTSSEWQDLWRGQAKRDYIPVDRKFAYPFGFLVTRPPSVTQDEWRDFWQKRSVARI